MSGRLDPRPLVHAVDERAERLRVPDVERRVPDRPARRLDGVDRPAHFDDVVERTVRGALLDGAVVDATGSGMSSSSGFFSTSEDYRSSYFVSPGDASTPGAACLDLDALQKGLAGFVTAVTAAGDARAVVVVTYSPIDGSEPRRFVLDTGEGGTAFAPAASEPAEPRAPDDDGTDG